jgi:hypothetical protein
VNAKFERAGTIEELKSKRRLILRGAHRPILAVEDQVESLLWTTAVRIWVFRSTVAASRTAF